MKKRIKYIFIAGLILIIGTILFFGILLLMPWGYSKPITIYDLKNMAATEIIIALVKPFSIYSCKKHSDGEWVERFDASFFSCIKRRERDLNSQRVSELKQPSISDLLSVGYASTGAEPEGCGCSSDKCLDDNNKCVKY